MGSAVRRMDKLLTKKGPLRRRRALNSEIGVRFPVATRNAMPGSRAERRPAVTRKAGVRAPPWQHTSLAKPPRSDAREWGYFANALPAGDESPLQAGWGTPASPLSSRFTDRLSRGRHPTDRIRARHARDAGSTPADHTHPSPLAGEVLKVRTLGSYPRGSGFDPRHRLHRDNTKHKVLKL